MRSGAAPQPGTIRGKVLDPTGAIVPGAHVQACSTATGRCPWSGISNQNGEYTANGLAPGEYKVQAYPLANTLYLPGTAGPVLLDVSLTGVDVHLGGARGLPAGLGLSPFRPGDLIPNVYWHDDLLLTYDGCAGGTVRYEVWNEGEQIRFGDLLEDPAGHYSGTIPAFYPHHGIAQIQLYISCPGQSTEMVGFDVYIDPSGFVRDTRRRAIPNAVVSSRASTACARPPRTATRRATPPRSRSRPGRSTSPPPRLDLELVLECAVTDTMPPVLSLPGDITTECTSPAGAPVSYSATAEDDVDGAVTAMCAPASGSTFALGTSEVSCTASDAAGNSAAGSFDVTVVDTTAPSISCPAPASLECAGCQGCVDLGGATASDLCGGVTVIDGRSPSGCYPLGSTGVAYTATGEAGLSASCASSVTVSDTTPPTISTGASAGSLWPANHDYVRISLDQCRIVASDACDTSLSGASAAITCVSSDEAVDAAGSGNTANDIVIVDARTVDLRRERAGNGDGRVYTIRCAVTDSTGNLSATGACTVAVPKEPRVARWMRAVWRPSDVDAVTVPARAPSTASVEVTTNVPPSPRQRRHDPQAGSGPCARSPTPTTTNARCRGWAAPTIRRRSGRPPRGAGPEEDQARRPSGTS